MPKLSYRAPKYAFHKASGQAVVRINSKLVYLGPWGSRESKDRYKQAVTRWADDQDRSAAVNKAVAKTLPESSTTLVELIAEYLDHADAYYQKNGQPTGTAANLRPILRLLKELFGALLVADFRPSHLDAFQGRMIQNGASRRYINDACSRVKTMFKWGVAKDLVPVATWQGLLAVRGLAKGRSKARETKPVLPVADEVVHATLPFLPPVVQDMVQFERLTGVRPGEVCTLRPCDVDRSGGDVWLYRPESHKCEHHDRGRVIAIGPKTQAVLLPYLLREGTAFCFSPRESELRRNAARREDQETPMTPSQEARKAEAVARQVG
jgi:integrase